MRRTALALSLSSVGIALVVACTDDSTPNIPDAAVDAGLPDVARQDGGLVTDATSPVDATIDVDAGVDADAAPAEAGGDASDAEAGDPDASDAASDADVSDAADAALPPNALKGTQVVTGERWSMVVSPSGALYAFGQYVDPANGHYQNGGTYARTPVVVQGVDSVKQVAGYGSAFFALKTDGTVYGWGFLNSYSAFGQGKDSNSGGVVTEVAPVQILTAAATPITNVCQIVASIYGVVMLRSAEVGGACTPAGARTVWFTGDSLTGYDPGLPPSLFARAYAPLDPASGSNVTGGVSIDRLYANAYYVNAISLFAQLTDGRVFAWGSNNFGQLGLGDQTARTLPTGAAAWDESLAIASSGEVTLAITKTGGVISAGSAYGATLGNGTQASTFQTTPAAVSTLTNVTRISVATSSPGALALQDGGLFYWGSSSHFGTVATTPRAVPSANGPFVDIGIGTDHALAINAQGGVFSWGTSQMGELGCGACTDRATPTLITVP